MSYNRDIGGHIVLLINIYIYIYTIQLTFIIRVLGNEFINALLLRLVDVWGLARRLSGGVKAKSSLACQARRASTYGLIGAWIGDVVGRVLEFVLDLANGARRALLHLSVIEARVHLLLDLLERICRDEHTLEASPGQQVNGDGRLRLRRYRSRAHLTTLLIDFANLYWRCLKNKRDQVVFGLRPLTCCQSCTQSTREGSIGVCHSIQTIRSLLYFQLEKKVNLKNGLSRNSIL